MVRLMTGRMWQPATTILSRWWLVSPLLSRPIWFSAPMMVTHQAQRGKRFPLSSLPNLETVSMLFVPPRERETLVGRSVYVQLSGFALRKTTNGELGEVFPAAFAVVIFMMALELAGLHESSARAHSGLNKNSCRFSRHNRVFEPRPVESSVYSENSRADTRATHAAPAPLVGACTPNNCHRTTAPSKCSVSAVFTGFAGYSNRRTGQCHQQCDPLRRSLGHSVSTRRAQGLIVLVPSSSRDRLIVSVPASRTDQEPG